MKKLGLIFGLWLALASSALAAVALVSGQVAGVTGSFATNNTVLTLPNNPTTGNFVAVCIVSNGTGTLTVTDSNSNSYTATTATPFTGSAGQYGIFYLANAPSNATKTLTITNTAIVSGLQIGLVAEFSGVATTTPFERDGTQTFGGSSATINTPSLTTTNNGDLLFGCAQGYSSISTANSPWTGVSTVQNTVVYAEYFVQSTAGAQAINFTQSTSNRWDAMAAAFKAGAGGGGSNGGIQPVFVFGLGP